MDSGLRNRMLSSTSRPVFLLRLIVLLPAIWLSGTAEYLTYAGAVEGRIARQPKVTGIQREKVVVGKLVESLPPPVPPQIANSQIYTFNALGKTLPPNVDSKPDRPTTLIIADTLQFEKQTYAFGSAENVIIVADTVQFKGNATFDLAAGRVVRDHRAGKPPISFRGRPKAGRLFIVARNYITEANGYLYFTNHGNKVNPSPGSLFIAAEKRSLQSKLPKQNQGEVYVQTFAMEAEKGALSEVFVDLGKMWVDKDINKQIPEGRYIVGYWAGCLLSMIAKDIQLTIPLTEAASPSALSPEEQELLINLVKQGKALIPIIRDLLSDEEVASLKVLDSKKWIDSAMTILSLWTDEVRLPSNNSAQVVYDGANQTVYLAPTSSLLKVVVNDNRRYLGYLDQHPQNPMQVLLSFDVKLSVDTDIEEEVKEALGRGGGGFVYKGAFTDYEVNASNFGTELPEVKSANVNASGGIIHVMLALDPESAGLALTRLASGTGVPLHLKWTYQKNANIKGSWQIPISLTRRDIVDVEKIAQGIRNSGNLAVTVEYILLSDHSIFPLDPPLVLQPGESKTITIPNLTDPAKILIPADAVSYQVAADPLREIFVRDSSIFDTVEITNLLGSHPTLGALQYVELTISYSYDPSEATAPAKKGPFRLSSKGTMGSRQKISFVRRRKGDRDIIISGVAIYESGSQQTLKSRTFHSLGAAIEADMLPAH